MPCPYNVRLFSPSPSGEGAGDEGKRLMPTSNLIQSLARVGVIQFGRFESRQEPGNFAPIAINLRMLTSYPDILKALAAEIAALATMPGMTHLLAMPSAVPLGTAITLQTGMPVVY